MSWYSSLPSTNAPLFFNRRWRYTGISFVRTYLLTYLPTYFILNSFRWLSKFQISQADEHVDYIWFRWAAFYLPRNWFSNQLNWIVFRVVLKLPTYKEHPLFNNRLCGRPPQYDPAPCDLYVWPFDLESGVRIMCDVDYLCANFSLPRPLCSRLRPDVRDRRQTPDVRQTGLIYSDDIRYGNASEV